VRRLPERGRLARGAAEIARDGARDRGRRDDRPTSAIDPTIHPTFTVPSRPEFRGRALSDLAFFEPDAALPEMQRRRVVSVQKALWSASGAFSASCG
jgi:hypothetical protein